MRLIYWLRPGLKIKRWLVAGLMGIFLVSVSISYHLLKFNIVNSNWTSILVGLAGLGILFFSLRQGIISILDFVYYPATGGAQLGVTAGSATAITADEIIDLVYSLKAPYRKNAVFLMNDATVKAIRKLKDGQGQYLWQPSLTAGTPDTLLNRPVYTSAYAPIIEAGAKTIAFGDFGYYWIADRQGRSFKRLNELFATTGQVGFLASQRVDGKLILPEAIKVLQQKA
jgi:HK97 family phage major capsid protein